MQVSPVFHFGFFASVVDSLLHEGLAFILVLLGQDEETDGLHGIGSLVDGVPAAHLVSLGVERLVALLELWGILGMVLWSDNGESLVSHWVVFLSDISGLLGFLLELFDALAHLRENAEILVEISAHDPPTIITGRAWLHVAVIGVPWILAELLERKWLTSEDGARWWSVNE